MAASDSMSTAIGGEFTYYLSDRPMADGGTPLVLLLRFSTRSFARLILGRVFHRFPKLKYIITEAGCGWVSESLAQLDRIWKMVASGAVGEFQFAADAVPPEAPSFYARRNVWYGASAASRGEIADREVVGVDRICWGSDYPHYEGTYPHTRLSLRHTFHDVPEGETRAMLRLNAAALYDFDMDALAPLVDRIGPRPDQVANALPREGIPTDTMSMAFA